jgi:acyl-CoA thioesterase FadM
MEEDGLSLPVIEAQCEYKAPARYDDELEIRTQGRLVSPVRLAFDYEVVRRATAWWWRGPYRHAAVNAPGAPAAARAREGVFA